MGNRLPQTATIGIVLPFLLSRGTEKQALRLGRGFQEKGFEVILFNIQGWGNLSADFRKAGIDVVNVGRPYRKVDREGKARPSKLRLFRLAYLARKYKCNLLLSRAFVANQICGVAANLARIPSVVVLSGPVPRWAKKRSFLRKKLSLLRFLAGTGFADYFVTVSSEGGDNLRSSFPSLANRIVTIHNGIDPDELDITPPLPTDLAEKKGFRLCYTGNIELERKGLDTLIDVLYELVHTKGQTDIELLLVGSGRDEKELRRQVEQRGLENNVIYAGEQKNPYPFMKSADLFILPSRREGLPNALLEAMALGVCSISTDCPTGPKEIIENNKNGILVPVDGKTRLVNEILRLKKNPELRRKLAASGKRTIQTKFTYKKMVEEYTKLLRTVLVEKRS